MRIKDLVKEIEQIAPITYQESYDNSGLIIGSYTDEVSKALLCLDITDQIVEEAIEIGADIIISHHPIVFSGLKKINGNNLVERVVLKAIKNNIAIYSAHTNLDNSDIGVNKRFCDLLNLNKTKILRPLSNNLYKLVFYTPQNKHEQVLEKVLSSGAGHIGNYDNCSFNIEGTGTFRALEGTNPFVGKQGELHKESEIRSEIVFPSHIKSAVISSLLNAHPYEEVAYDIFKIENNDVKYGSGMVGELEGEVELSEFLKTIKEKFNTEVIKYNSPVNKKIKKVAVCGGSGSFLVRDAIAKKADIFITGDVKYHEFFDLEEKICIADIGHFESEKHIINLFYDIIINKFPNFACEKTKINSNPINYF